jgi:SAM-dependent methyltransferase
MCLLTRRHRTRRYTDNAANAVVLFHDDTICRGFVSELTKLYKQRIKPGSAVLDMMSSWVSHLPKDVEYSRVDGHGLNREELEKNSQLTSIKVQDLNAMPYLAFPSDTYDAVVCCVSVQYLQQPERVFADVYRILKPGGVAIFSFSNRMFSNKAITAWMNRDDNARAKLVSEYFNSVTSSSDSNSSSDISSSSRATVKGFTKPEVIVKDTAAGPLGFLGSLLGVSGDPFMAVIAYKDYKQ